MACKCNKMPYLGIEALLIANIRNREKVVFSREEVEYTISNLLKQMESNKITLDDPKFFAVLVEAINQQDDDIVIDGFKHMCKLYKFDIVPIINEINKIKEKEKNDKGRISL